MSQYIVMDLEWNQTPNFRSPGIAELPFEVIEIGAVKLDEQLEIVSEFQGLVRPSVYRKMNRKITEVTHLTMEELRANGRSFPEVMDDFLTWCGSSFMFCTWGSMDLTELQRNMVYFGMELPFPVPFLYYDLQKIYGMIIGSTAMESLDRAAAEMGIPPRKTISPRGG
jgi:inhibitor of KinA sporulation pathway (predicted exonuclease)